MNKPTFKELYYLCIQKLTNFPYIEQDFDALTNYELLCKVVEELNKMIDNMNTQNESIIALYKAFNEIKDYIDNYFENLDVQEEINNKLDEMVKDGTLEQILRPYLANIIEEQDDKINNMDLKINQMDTKINSVVNNNPIPVNSIENMTDTTKIYLLTTNGYWYYYNGTSWVQGGLYQSTGLSTQDTDTINSINFFTNLFNNNYNEVFKHLGFYRDGVFDNRPTSTYLTSDFIDINVIKNLDLEFYIPSPITVQLINYFDSDKVFISGNNNNDFINDIKNNPNIKYARFSIHIGKNSYKVRIKNNITTFSQNKFYENKGLKSYDNTYLQVGFYTYGVLNTGTSQRLCNINPIKLVPFLTTFKVSNDYVLTVQLFDINMKYLRYIPWYNEISFTPNENEKYCLFNIAKGDRTEDIDLEDNVNLQITDYNQITKDILINSFTSNYTNKKINALGDSITYGLGLSQNIPRWVDYVKNRLGLSVARNYGISNSTITNLEGHDPMCLRYVDMNNDADLIIVLASRNDYVYGASMGTKGSSDNTTFYGALKTLLDGLWDKYPTKTIIFCTMYKARKTTDSDELKDNEWANSKGLYQEDYNDAIKDICKDYAIPVIDLYNTGTFNSWNLYSREAWFQDTVHPNADGQEVLGNILSNRINSL